MKRILITGEKSYIGQSLKRWLSKFGNDYYIEVISVRNDSWKKKSFEEFDVVVNVAGIAHVKPKRSLEELFYRVNRDLTIEIAKKSLEDGVSQYIFLSSMNVFGDINEIITKDTLPIPKNFYGKSKLEADIAIQDLNSNNFNVVSIRPPVVYGENCKGNFSKLSNFAKLTPFFPDYKNKRSIIYIDNLCEFIRLIIDNKEQGIFYPQNKQQVSTKDIVEEIATLHGKKISTNNFYNPLIKFLIKRVRIINKIFGDDLYHYSISNYKDYSYCVIKFKDSIRKIEKNQVGS